MPDPPLLSICIPAYNRPQWLGRSLHSILQQPQAIEGIELIISDDSTDHRCHQVVQESLKNWAGTWHYCANQPPLGMAANWNHSIQQATGEFVLVLHDDDFLLPSAIPTLLSTLNQWREQYSVFRFGVKIVNEQEHLLRLQTVKSFQYLPPAPALIQLLSNSSFVRFPAIVVRRDLYQTTGGFKPEWGGPADTEMWLRLFSQCGVVCLPAVTAAYRVHSQALTMAMFNPSVIATALKLFDLAASLPLLDQSILEQCKAKFFHQFILAGTFRQLRRGRLNQAAQIMQLFELQEMRSLPCPVKWLPFRILFQLIVNTYQVLTVR